MARQGRGARYDAFHNGQIHYNGAPCKKCGNTLRYTTNYSCIVCESKRIKRKNKEYKISLNFMKSRYTQITK